MVLLFKYTSRSRADKFFRGLNSIVDNLSDKDNYWVQCTFDLSDATMFNTEVIKRLNEYKNISYYFGESISKIDAINKNLDKLPPFSILINMSDDMIFTQHGFDVFIREAMMKYYPDGSGWLHFFDGNQPRLATMSVIGEKYFRRTNYIYHHSYKTEWADNEEQCKAQILGKYKYMGGDLKIMEHINPYHGHQGTMDELYLANAVYSNSDKDNFFVRQALNFEL